MDEVRLPLSTKESMRRSVNSCTRGANSAMRRGVNAFDTRRRSRVWSGGSMFSRCVISSALRSPGMPVRPLACAGPAWCAGFLESRVSARACLASAYRVTSQASTPLGRVVRCTGLCSRSQAYAGYGSVANSQVKSSGAGGTASAGWAGQVSAGLSFTPRRYPLAGAAIRCPPPP